MCFVDLEKALDKVSRKVLVWAMRKKGIPNVLVRSVISLYEGAKTRVRVDFEFSEEIEAFLWRCTKDLCCHLFFLHLW